MKNLDFCQQCEVYHHLALVAGHPGFVECENRIQEDFAQSIDATHVDQRNSKQSTPNSKASFTSIQNQITPRPTLTSQSNTFSSKEKIKQENKEQSLLSQNSNKIRQMHFPNPKITYVPQIIVTQPRDPPQRHQPVNYLPSNISISISRPPAPQSLPLQLKSTMRNLPHFQRQPHSLLSTIKEQKYDESELSKSVYTNEYPSAKNSKRSSFDPIPMAQLDSIKSDDLQNKQEKICPLEEGDFRGRYKFKDMKKKYEIDLNSHKESQKFCWCW